MLPVPATNMVKNPSVLWAARAGTAVRLKTAAARLRLHHQQNVCHTLASCRRCKLLATATMPLAATMPPVARIQFATKMAQLLLIKYASVDGDPMLLKRVQ